MKKKSHARPRYIREAERNRVQGNRVISVWKVSGHGQRHGHGHGCLVKHIASRWDANNNNKNFAFLLLGSSILIMHISKGATKIDQQLYRKAKKTIINMYFLIICFCKHRKLVYT